MTLPRAQTLPGPTRTSNSRPAPPTPSRSVGSSRDVVTSPSPDVNSKYVSFGDPSQPYHSFTFEAKLEVVYKSLKYPTAAHLIHAMKVSILHGWLVLEFCLTESYD